MRVDLSICILTYNKLEHTRNCLESLIISLFPDETELIIVDNGSSDGTQEWLIQFQKLYSKPSFRIVIVLNSTNYGATGGRNQACRMANGVYILTMDNDTIVVERNWIIELIDAYNQFENIGIIGPKLIFPNKPNRIQHAGFGVTKDGKIGYWGFGKSRDDMRYNKTREVQGLASACWLLRKELFERYGYFDDIYYPVNFEDADFCYRIREQGYKTICYPAVELFHVDHATTKNSKDIPYIRGIAKNSAIFRKRWKHMFTNEMPMPDNEFNLQISNDDE